MARVGVIGLGFMGRVHLNAYRLIPNSEIVAICDTSGRGLDGDFSFIKGNVGSEKGFQLEMANVKGTRDPFELMRDPAIDLIDICTPTDTHRDLVIAALGSGKHVVCEKPLARTSADARLIAEAAEHAPGFLFPAMVLRFTPQWDFLKQAVDDGRYGKVLNAHFRRVCEPPAWGHDFYFDGARSGGALLDLHLHDIDFIQYCFGRPKRVYASGRSIQSSAIDYVFAQFSTESNIAIYAEGGWTTGKGYGFHSTFTVNFEHATLEFNSEHSDSLLRVYEGATGGETISLPQIDGYFAELQYMIEAIQDNRVPTVVTAYDAVRAIEIIEAEEESISSGEVVELNDF